jgi:hypothetical protein
MAGFKPGSCEFQSATRAAIDRGAPTQSSENRAFVETMGAAFADCVPDRIVS